MKKKIIQFKNFIVEILTCRKKIKELEENSKSPSKIIEAVLGRGINWYDYEKLDLQKQINYYNDAQRILCNETFANETKYFLGDLIQEIAVSEAVINKDKMLRFSINGLKTFIERLEHIYFL